MMNELGKKENIYEEMWNTLYQRLEWMITDKNNEVNRESGEGIRIARVLDLMDSLEEE